MRTTWAAVLLTLAGAAAASAAPPETLPAPRAIEHGTMPVPPAAPAPAAVAPDLDGHLFAPHPCNCGCARKGCWQQLCAWLTYCPKPRGVNCYNCCEPLYPPLYTFFPPCVEGHCYKSDCSSCTCTSGHRAFQGRGGLGLGMWCRGCLGGCFGCGGCGCGGRGTLVAD